LNYAEKQGKKDITCRDDNTYFAMDDNKINFKKLNPKTEFPIVNNLFFTLIEVSRILQKTQSEFCLHF